MGYEVKRYEPSGMGYDAMRHKLLSMGSKGNRDGPLGKDTLERGRAIRYGI